MLTVKLACEGQNMPDKPSSSPLAQKSTSGISKTRAEEATGTDKGAMDATSHQN
jgi:hypothetical protein